MKWQTDYRGKTLQPNILVRNQFLALHHQLYVMNYKIGQTENSVTNGKKQRSKDRLNSFSSK